MATNLSAEPIKDTYTQLLHISEGVTGTPNLVRGGDGAVTTLKLGSVSAVFADYLTISDRAIAVLGGTFTLSSDQNITVAPGASYVTNLPRVSITSGTITGITDLAVADGAAAGVRTNLGLGSIATQDSNDVSITGGTITGGTISGVTMTGSFTGVTSIESGELHAKESLGYVSNGTSGVVTQSGSKSATVTLDKPSGRINMHGATLNRSSSVSFTLSNTYIASTDIVVVNISANATASAYDVVVDQIVDNSCRIQVRNHLTGTDLSEALVLNFAVIKAVID